MTSSRPYLIRALYQWIVDNGVTPYILVDALVDGVDVPAQYIQDNKIVLNIAPTAVHGLTLGDDVITFNARFSGKSTNLFVPVEAVLAIYARENGQGMMFSEEPQEPEPPTDGDGPADDSDSSGKPNLRVVK
ncbi:MAG: ClpXP protease specificity-enhancing factor [Gammaproteobacteria bacterium]|nr:ClpXP protease specificity-enhancing factor [Gammaproteobacteria bacterium]MCW8910550.1 ClpXP protease specificity-enhancing factor [Gammaproteobacteria bacterium]MCW9004117.1 ClpXP protease specificity-enhancing factor [Gammaproteobacteria bacterium]MCW9055232.1 ClpXP protease specificity-enhancing factor [Gammaproteobacteria bacterium]